ncbi:MAG: collagen-like protein [Methanoregula sp.]
MNVTQGIQGIQGPQGNQGNPGAPGSNGSNGTSCTIDINHTFTLSPGSAATVNNVGTTTAGLLDIGIPQGLKGDTGTIPDVSQFLFLNGSRSMTGNLSVGSNYITGLHLPSVSTDAATKGYCDAIPIYNASYLTSTFNSTYDAKPSSTFNATYDSKPSSTYNATYDAKTNYNASYWTGTNYNGSYVTLTNTSYVLTGNGSYILGTNTSYVLTNNASYVLTSNTSYILGTNTTHVLTNNGSYILGTNTSYVITAGTNAMTGNLSLGSHYINSVISGNLGNDAVNRSYTGTHGAAASITSGSTINHLLGTTPTGCQVQPTVANSTMAVSAMSSTTFTVLSWRTNSTAAGISQTVYWECWV